MTSEKNFFPGFENETEKSKIIIKRSSDVPPEVKKNPFYDSEIWGSAYSPNDIYLPDFDVAISLAVGAHEIGHLYKPEVGDDARLDNFEATRAEEQRAWETGRKYLQKYVDEYYQNNPENIPKIHQAFERIKTLFMKMVDLSKEMYLENGALDNLNPEEIEKISNKRREKFFSEKGDEFKNIFNDVKKEKIGVKPNWDEFTAIITKAVEDILRDNENKS